jgi:peroxiredoxin
MVRKIVVGQKAPDFVLFDFNMKPTRLSDFLGKKVVLAFYPGAFTSVCTKEMCTLRDTMAKLNALDAQVIGVSVNDPFSNKAFSSANSLSFPLLSDYNRVVVEIYGVALPDFAGLKGYTAAKRSVFIINTKGIVQYVWVSDKPGIEPNYEEIEKVLSEIS